MYFRVLLVLLFASISLSAKTETQQNKLVSGPMLGYIEHKEALIWIQTNCAKNINIKYYPLGKATEAQSKYLTLPQVDDCKRQISKIILKDLQPETNYNYLIEVDNKEVTQELSFKTPRARDYKTSKDFSFLIGSCAFIKDPVYNAPWEHFEGDPKIYETMGNQEADFMIWLGDALYLREVDFTTESGIDYRYWYRRKLPEMQKMLSKYSHYAIWDDHDYGPNNSNKTFELHQKTLQAFRDYWGNKTFGDGEEGIYGKFSYEDADFFLLDDRYFRDDTEINERSVSHKTQLGDKQIQWLKSSLSGSTATFKFIAVGGQFTNQYTDKESFNQYKKERKEIVDFITANKIKGVVFLSGDRHHSEMLRFERANAYPLLELTSSPLSSGVNTPIYNSDEINNPQRIEGTLLVEPNFCKINVLGTYSDRYVKFECFDKFGSRKFEKSFTQDELSTVEE
jgi:alkaline phosphatase D